MDRILLVLLGITAWIPSCRKVFRMSSLSYALSITAACTGQSAGTASRTAFATVASFCWPGVSMTTRAVSSSAAAKWILVLKPPLLRPSPWASCPPFFAQRQPHVGVPEPPCCPETGPYRRPILRQAIPQKGLARCPAFPSGEDAGRRHPTHQNRPEDHARESRCAPDTRPLPQTP